MALRNLIDKSDYAECFVCFLQPQLGSTATEEQQKAIDAQIQRVKKLFHRQLSVPLRGMDSLIINS